MGGCGAGDASIDDPSLRLRLEASFRAGTILGHSGTPWMIRMGVHARPP